MQVGNYVIYTQGGRGEEAKSRREQKRAGEEAGKSHNLIMKAFSNI